MRKETFLESIEENIPPDNLMLKALWLDYKGQWNAAHQLVDDIGDKDAAWIHAYLHRKEGDLWNAGYWYRQAGREVANCSLNEEWEILVKQFCDEKE